MKNNSLEQLKQLREETGVSITECQKALKEASNDINKAKEILRKRGQQIAGKRSGREMKQGIVVSYIHPNSRVGVLLDIRCESDFVAKSEDFKKLAHEICLQIAAMNPLFAREEDVPKEVLGEEKKIYQEQFKSSGKPQKIIDEIIEGKLKKYKETACLYFQPWIKDEAKNIKTLIEEVIAKIGENIEIKKFSRYEM